MILRYDIADKKTILPSIPILKTLVRKEEGWEKKTQRQVGTTCSFLSDANVGI
jgi:hypothetical protein